MDSMNFRNDISVFVARRRWLKRSFKKWLPRIAHHKIFNKINFHFDPRDLRGPSFHFAFDLERGFLNYEEDSRNELLENVPRDGIFYDIGANIGMYSVYFAHKRPDIRLFCFEPEPLAYTCIQKTMDSFCENKVTVFNKAIGQQKEEKKLYKSERNDGGHSFYHREGEDPNAEFAVVSVVNLDEMVENGELPKPNALKIDVEGFELEVLKGSEQTIRLAKPFMLIESDNQDLAQKGEFWSFLKRFENDGLITRCPGDRRRLNLEDLSKHAKHELQFGNKLSNYFYYFS